MTEEQFDDIKNKLAKWREDRHLDMSKQRIGYLGNVYEEISEYYRAKDEYEKIDAIMDIAVFTLNAFDIDYDFNINSDLKEMVMIDEVIETINQNDIICIEYDYKLIREIEVLAFDYGFSFYHCMIETINEISSRTGHYDNKINKFIKDKGAYNLKEANKHFTLSYLYKEDKDYWYFLTLTGIKKIKKWYQADYSKCKLD